MAKPTTFVLLVLSLVASSTLSACGATQCARPAAPGSSANVACSDAPSSHPGADRVR